MTKRGDDEIVFEHTFDQPLPTLSETVSSVEMGMMFNTEIARGDLPGNLRKLKLGYSFNQRLSLPDSVEELEFGTRFNRELESPLPTNLSVLRFGERFNQRFARGILPENLREISFGMSFDTRLEKGILPENLEYLDLGKSYNHKLERGVLPRNLKTLVLSFSYNHPVGKGVLPEGLLEIRFGEKFNQPIGRESLPKSLVNIQFGYDFDQDIGGVLPNISELHLGDGYTRPLVPGDIPESVKRLNLGFEFNRDLSRGIIPNGVERLTLGIYTRELHPGSLPDSIHYLDMGISYNHPLHTGILPRNIKYLKLSNLFTQPLRAGHLPEGLEDLIFGNAYNANVVFPSSLRSVVFGDDFNRPLPKGVLPTYLERLVLGKGFVGELHVPDHVGYLDLGTGFSGEIDLPGSIKVLILGSSFKRMYAKIPRSVTSLSIGGVSVKPSIYHTWVESVSDMTAERLERMYHLGIPVPVSPHEKTQLPIKPEDLYKIQLYSGGGLDHRVYLNSLDGRLKKLLKKWIYGDYYRFNLFISELNMGRRTKYDDEDFVSDYISDVVSDPERAAVTAYRDLRRVIVDAPGSTHKIYAWRGMRGLTDMCMDLRPGDFISFTRFMACSVSQEVSCKFASGGVLLLVELPQNTPLLDLTSLKESEPEILLPDRTIFQVTGMTSGSSCFGMTCKEILKIKLIGLYTETETGDIVIENNISGHVSQIDIRKFY